jgi:hypothetical protein
MFDPCRGRGGFGAAFPPLKRGARIVEPLPGHFAGRSGCVEDSGDELSGITESECLGQAEPGGPEGMDYLDI